jgi:hypothetical protein
MAVEVVYRSSYQQETLFMTKAEADAHDRMLEVAENLASLFRFVLPSLSEDDAESLAVYVSGCRNELIDAIKKNPSAILELAKPKESATSSVVPLANAS